MSDIKEHKQFVPKNPKETLLRLFGYFRYNKIMLFGGIFFIMISSIAQIAANAMLSPIIDTLVDDYDKGQFIKYLIIMGIFIIFIVAGQYIGSISMAKLAQGTVHKIRKDMFSHMEKLPVSFFDTNSHGDLMSTFTNDVDMLTQALEQSISQVVLSAITVFGTFIMMIILSPVLTLVVVGMQ